MCEVAFKNRKPNPDRLIHYGFEKRDDAFVYSSALADGQMTLTVTVSVHGEIRTAVTDSASGEEYVLHRVPGAAGSFVGQVKAEYEAVLDDIAAQCFETEVFKTPQAKEVIAYVREKYGDDPAFLWAKFPGNAVWRRRDNEKWYGALLTVKAEKLGMNRDDTLEILDLRIHPEEIACTVDNMRFFPGYHMNKKHWYTLLLNGSIETEEICRRIDQSYRYASGREKHAANKIK